MKYGIYYAYWEKEWGGDFLPYIPRVKKLGFDILEIALAGFPEQSEDYMRALRETAEAEGILLTGGFGPPPEVNLSSADPAIVANGFRFWEDTLRKMEIADIHFAGGATYSYWPIDFTKPFDKQADWERSVANVRKLADMAADRGVTLGMEVLNRFEGYLMNECAEGVAYVDAVDRPNVKLVLDTFHMNMEEDSFGDAIRLAGKRLGHVHVGEPNRRPPHAGSRINWQEIGDALREIDYPGYIVMEPFERMGGKVGQDISIWRDLSNGATDEDLDSRAAASVKYLRELWG